MIGKIRIAWLWVSLTVSIASSQTTIPGGNVSGIWEPSGQPYLIEGNITVPVDQTLTIAPACSIIFQGDYRLVVNGILEAVGTEADSIHFFPAVTTLGWQGIRFVDAPDSSHLDYCTIRHTGTSNPLSNKGAIYCSNSNPVITHCTLSDNYCDDYGGALSIVGGSGPLVSQCIISNNASPYGNILIHGNSTHAVIAGCTISRGNGGYSSGISLYESGNTILTDCIISGSQDVQAPGIYGYYSSATMMNCVIRDHTEDADGGGMLCWSFNATLINCTISNNTTTGDNALGGGIACIYPGSNIALSYCTFDSNRVTGFGMSSGGGAIGLEDGRTNMISIDHCTFNDNRAWLARGEAIYIGAGGQVEISNSIFANNWAHGAIWVDSGGTLSAVTYTDFYDNSVNVVGSAPAGFGVLTTTNANGDPCDIHYNIFEQDPLFADPEAGDFQLTWESFPIWDESRSPCIDAGDPSSLLNPDGTITDMGAFWFDQRRPVIALSTDSLDFGVIPVGNQADLPLTVYNQGDATLVVGDVSCDLNCYWTDFDPADSLIAAGDSLELTVSFIPPGTLLYTGTMIIANNDVPVEVELLGRGDPVSGVEEGLPVDFTVQALSPNATNRRTSFRLELPEPATLRLSIYDLSGRRVVELQDEWRPAGVHELILDASGLASGLYLFRFEAGTYCAAGRLVQLR